MERKTTGLVIHNPITSTIHFGIDARFQLHVWWGDERPAEVVEIDAGLPWPQFVTPEITVTLEDAHQ